MRTTITAIATLALGLGALTACTTTDPEPTPTPTTVTTTLTESTTPTPTHASQSSTPTTASPSPTTTQTLDADQNAARDVVLQLYQLQNRFSMDDSLKDLTPLTDITTGAAQQQVVAALDDYRALGATPTAPVVVSVEKVGSQAIDPAGTKMIDVVACVDATGVDMVNKETGKSVLAEGRNQVNLFTLEVVNEDNGWLVSDIAAKPTKACS